MDYSDDESRLGATGEEGATFEADDAGVGPALR